MCNNQFFVFKIGTETVARLSQAYANQGHAFIQSYQKQTMQ